MLDKFFLPASFSLFHNLKTKFALLLSLSSTSRILSILGCKVGSPQRLFILNWLFHVVNILNKGAVIFDKGTHANSRLYDGYSFLIMSIASNLVNNFASELIRDKGCQFFRSRGSPFLNSKTIRVCCQEIEIYQREHHSK